MSTQTIPETATADTQQRRPHATQSPILTAAPAALAGEVRNA